MIAFELLARFAFGEGGPLPQAIVIGNALALVWGPADWTFHAVRRALSSRF